MPAEGRKPPISAEKAAEIALRHIADLTGAEPLGVISVAPEEDGWVVGVEVLEDAHIPSSSDILALYEAELDMDGTLRSYRRIRRYPRGSFNGLE